MKTNENVVKTKAKRIEKILVFCCYFTFSLLLLSIFALSSLKNIVPIILGIIFSLEVGVYIVAFGKLHFDFLVISLLLFLLHVILTTCIFSKDFSGLKTYLTVIPLACVSFELFYNTKDFKAITMCFIFASISFCFIFVFFYRSVVFSGNAFSSRLGEIFGGINACANTLLLGVVVSLIYLLAFKKYVLSILCFLLCSFCILLTGSKGAFIGVFFTLLIFIYLFLFKKNKLAFFIVLGVFIAATILLLSLNVFSSINERILSLFNLFSGNGNTSYSSRNRLTMMIGGIEYWSKYLFTGCGAGGFSYASGYHNYSHATISESLCNFGIIGTTLLFFPIIYCLIKSKSKPIVHTYFCMFVFGFLLIEMFATAITIYKIFYLFLAVLYSMYSANNDELFCFNIFVSNSPKRKIQFEYFAGKTVLRIHNRLKEIDSNETL